MGVRLARIVVVGGVAAVSACASFGSDESGPSTPVGAEAGEGGLPSESGSPPPPPGTVFEVVTGVTDPRALTATESNVYWTERGPGFVRSVKIEGGSPTEIYDDGGSPTDIAVLEGNVVWADGGKERIRQIPLAGGVMKEIYSATGAAPKSMVATSTLLFFAGGDKNVHWLLPGGAPILPQGPYVFPYNVAAFGDYVYFTDTTTGTVWRGPTGGGPPTSFATNESSCEVIAASAAGVFWSVNGTDVKGRLSDGGSVVVSTSEKRPSSLAADETGLYWLTDDGKLRFAAGHKAPVTTLAEGFTTSSVNHLHALALASKYIVWISHGTTDGRILRRAKN